MKRVERNNCATYMEMAQKLKSTWGILPAAIDLTDTHTHRQTDESKTFTFLLLRAVKITPFHLNLMVDSMVM